MDRAITIPPEAAIPCKKRNKTNIWILGAKIQAVVEKINSHIEKIRGRRRPILSLSGPNTNCPKANPSIENVNPICTMETLVANSLVIIGSPGRYISVTNGPKAVNMPRNVKMKLLELRLADISFP